MGDKDGGGWPHIEPLPKLPAPKPRQAPAPPSPSAPPPVPFPPPPPGQAYPPSGQPSNATAWWITGMLGVVVVLLVAVGVAVSTDDGDERGAPSTTDDVTSDREPIGPAAETTTTAPTTTTTTSTTAPPPPAPPPPGLDNGTHLVGQDIAPGLYMSSGGFGCYWERRSALDNGLDGVIVNGGAFGQAIVEIKGSDFAFMSDGCGRWVDYAAPPEPVTSFGDGDWVVGEQIAPGTYAADPPASFCYWERATGFTHDISAGEVIINEFAEGNATTVTIRAGERFSTEGCGTWAPA